MKVQHLYEILTEFEEEGEVVIILPDGKRAPLGRVSLEKNFGSDNKGSASHAFCLLHVS